MYNQTKKYILKLSVCSLNNFYNPENSLVTDIDLEGGGGFWKLSDLVIRRLDFILKQKN